jgi:hypothetical protein
VPKSSVDLRACCCALLGKVDRYNFCRCFCCRQECIHVFTRKAN